MEPGGTKKVLLALRGDQAEQLLDKSRKYRIPVSALIRLSVDEFLNIGVGRITKGERKRKEPMKHGNSEN